jgi:hypothetical protein
MKLIVLKGKGIISEFTDVIFHELKQKYNEIEYKENYDPKDKNILHFIISPHKEVIPERFILYNLEPLNFRIGHKKDYMEKIKKAEQVWEYSKTNLQVLKQFNKNIIYQPFLYSPIMEDMYNICQNNKKDIDILFYGLMSQRRIKIIKDLQKVNINVYCPNYPIHKPVWGQEKIDLISRAKIVINIHYHSDPKDQTNDLLRIMFLLANKVPVVQEETLDKDLDDKLKDIIVPYSGIVPRCKELLAKTDEELKQFSKKMYNLVKTDMRFNLT